MTYDAPGWVITPYLISLCVVSEAVALLTLGLVREWGETFPSWMPVIRGRPVPVMLAVTPALVGGAVLTVVGVAGALLWNTPDRNGNPEAPQGTAGIVMAICYAPMLLWGPCVLYAAGAYWRRRRRTAVGPLAGSEAA